MSLSQERTENLRQNKDKIMAFAQARGEVNFMGIPRGITRSGYMCAGMACMNESERGLLEPEYNGQSMASVIAKYHINVNKEDLLIINQLEADHDEYIMSEGYNTESLDELKRQIDEILA